MTPDRREGSADDKVYLFDRPRNIRRVIHSLYMVCGVLWVLDFVIDRHIYHPWERIPEFYAIYGFLGCVVLVMVARWMRTFLMRPEDYYMQAEDQPQADPEGSDVER